MAFMKIEVAASSSPFSYVSLRDHNRSTSKVDDSWLPTSSHNSTVTSESGNSNHQNGKNVVDDDSWLPTVNDSDEKYGEKANESENDIDYSWLPSSFIENKQKNISIKKNKHKVTNTNKNVKKESPQKKSRNNHWALAREVVFSTDHQQGDSCSESRYVVESPTSGGVSSLLQRWRDLAEAKNSNQNENDSTSSSNSQNYPGSTSTESKLESSRSTVNEKLNANTDWESDKASRRLSCPLPSRDSKDSNPGGAEKEKIRVVDIIKKLSREEELAASHATTTNGNGNGNGSLPPIRTNHNQFENENSTGMIKGVKVSRHLIRGRQAFNNFLMQMERQKHHDLKWLTDRKAVSKFSHRGRIQALLRFKILRLGAEPKQESRRHRRCISKTLESNNRSDIMDLRERFNSGVEKGATIEMKSKTTDIKNTTKEETSTVTSTSTRMVDFKATQIKKQEQQPKVELLKNSNRSTQYITGSCKDAGHKPKFVENSSKSIVFKEDKHYREENIFENFFEDEGQFMSARTSYSQVEDRGFSDLEETNYINNKQGLESFNDWMTNDYSHTPSYLDEDESYEMHLFTDYDWVSDISRPKSDWENMRQARYKEMRNSSSGNGDIQRLLERKTVSRFLGSSLCDLIDQLMASRIQQSHVPVEKQDKLMREKCHSKKEFEQEEGSMVDEDGDCRSRSETKCSEYSEYVDHPYSERSWRPNDVVNNSETTTTTSPSLEHSPSTNRSRINSSPQSPSPIIRRSIEMELIYDLKGHMEQLHQEIMELRKSIKSCVHMQVKMQHSFKQNVLEATTNLPVQKKERNPHGLVKHNCSICHVMQVDSLLYKCGHMCTCFKCALEVQHASGACPMCDAPIVDVVKAFTHGH